MRAKTVEESVTMKHLPVTEFVTPQKFQSYGDEARKLGFIHVASGPMVRSSYHADEFTADAIPPV